MKAVATSADQNKSAHPCRVIMVCTVHYSDTSYFEIFTEMIFGLFKVKKRSRSKLGLSRLNKTKQIPILEWFVQVGGESHFSLVLSCGLRLYQLKKMYVGVMIFICLPFQVRL
jgi:hypothetical protein